MAFPIQEEIVNWKEAFFEYLTKRKQADNFNGFKIKWRVTDPHNGRVNFVVKADGPQKYGSIPHHGLNFWCQSLSKSYVYWRRVCLDSKKTWLASWLNK